ncbi:thiol peroxidase [Aquitalea sp. LB_tupeE]|uniref:thiol peroxidase n=1 Tax=Aquitalea sp. LB_tupeE TaxID=2748078 RepID=UPI0015B7DE06|nr:thiol peroxidase [Aquitalea sp. LB_tupeE]NWK77081.1 thiol peroxidase [Aquitalea sp. LB_tupeE]
MSDFILQYGDEDIPVAGDFPQVGHFLPSFMLVDEHKRDLALENFAGRPKAIITLLSVDEGEHAGLALLQDTRRFLESWPELAIIVITVDSPSSLLRCRQAHGLPGVSLLSTLRGRDFHKQYGVLAMGYPLSGYTAPAILIADGDNLIHYAERLHHTTDRFNQHAIAALLTADPEQDNTTAG